MARRAIFLITSLAPYLTYQYLSVTPNDVMYNLDTISPMPSRSPARHELAKYLIS